MATNNIIANTNYPIDCQFELAESENIALALTNTIFTLRSTGSRPTCDLGFADLCIECKERGSAQADIPLLFRS